MEKRTCFGDLGVLGCRRLLRRLVIDISEREDGRRPWRTVGRGSLADREPFRGGEFEELKDMAGRVADEESWVSVARAWPGRPDSWGVEDEKDEFPCCCEYRGGVSNNGK